MPTCAKTTCSTRNCRCGCRSPRAPKSSWRSRKRRPTSPASRARISNASCARAPWRAPTTATGNCCPATSRSAVSARAARSRSTWKAPPSPRTASASACLTERCCASATSRCTARSSCRAWPTSFIASASTSICASACAPSRSFAPKAASGSTRASCGLSTRSRSSSRPTNGRASPGARCAMAGESRLPVYGAMAANIAIAVTKFIVAGITGSSSMLSEGIHSVVDTANDALLLVGMERSKKEASQLHPFGHGRELYFWSLIVAVLIFGLGGGVSMYEGLLHILDPHPLEDPFWNYVVLGCSAVFEGISFAIAMKQFIAAPADDTTILQAVHVSKDPSTYTIVAEDGAALGGRAIAAGGVYVSHLANQPAIDGGASMLI